MSELTPRQLRNLKDKIDQARIRVRAAEQNLARAKERGATHNITSLSRTVRTEKDNRDALIRQLTGAAPRPTRTRGGRREW